MNSTQDIWTKIVQKLLKKNLTISAMESCTGGGIANEITNFGVQKRKELIINITNLDEPIKKKLRGAIKYFNGEMNNIAVEVQDGENILKCGAIYLTGAIYEVFQDIVGKENIELREI